MSKLRSLSANSCQRSRRQFLGPRECFAAECWLLERKSSTTLESRDEEKKRSLRNPESVLSQLRLDRLLLRRSNERITGVRELHFREIRLNLYSHEFSLCATVTGERQKILIAKMQLKFVQIRLKRNGSAGAKIVALTAGFVSHFAQVVLAQIGKPEGAAAMANSGRVDAPEIDVFALRSRDYRIDVRIE